LESLEATQALGGDESAEAKVKELISELLNQIDEPIDEEEAYEKVKPQDQNPLKIVLLQEITRYNKLLKFVRKNLVDLERGINGLVLISEDLEKVMISLFENKVPEKWKFAYYSLKPLSLWMLDLNKRIDQLETVGF
jgi:dynein heavy chain